jgi:F0F1-type ATP synthase assembly protein I
VASDPSGKSDDRRGGWQSSLHDASPYLTIGIQLAGTMVVYVIGGYLLDRWLDTAPIFLIIGSVTGMVAFFVQIVRLVRELNEREKARKGAGKDADDPS